MFNLKKAKIESVEPLEMRANESLERQHSLEGEVHGNTDWLLSKNRTNKDIDTTIQGQLKSVREGSDLGNADGRVTEGQLEHHKSPTDFVPTRKEGIDDLQMSPLAALNAAQEAEHVKAFNDASEKRDTGFWDKYLGVQLQGKRTKVPAQVSNVDSQLQNAFDRTKSLKPDDMGQHAGLKEMVMASMKDADAMLFFLYHKAASEKRELNAEEKTLVDGITADKVKLANYL